MKKKLKLRAEKRFEVNLPWNFKSKTAGFCQNDAIAKFTKKAHVASELIFFHTELWVENNNPQHRHTPFAISKKFISIVLRIMGRANFCRSICCFKSYSGAPALLGYLHGYLPPQRNEVNGAPFNLYQNPINAKLLYF